MQGYDIIGDIHGHALALSTLLKRLGYILDGDCYRHPVRKAIFVGDFIDRGPGQRQVMKTVMPMVRAGAALAIMGNHELNAIGFHTPDPSQPDTWLRRRSDKNIFQHIAFLNEYLVPGREKELREVLDFFRSLPLWLDLPGIRVVHACWHPGYMQVLAPHLDEGKRLLPDAIASTFREGTAPFKAIEVLLKGMECELPPGVSYRDKDGTMRHRARVRWWKQDAANFGELALSAGPANPALTALPVSADTVPGYSADDKPVFFGHYWFTGTPGPIASKVACLDYSVANGGPLVAYRWSGESELQAENFFFHGQEPITRVCR